MQSMTEKMAGVSYYLCVVRYDGKPSDVPVGGVVECSISFGEDEFRYAGIRTLYESSTLVTRWFIESERHAAELVNRLSGDGRNMFHLSAGADGEHPTNVPDIVKWATHVFAPTRNPNKRKRARCRHISPIRLSRFPLVQLRV